MRRFRCRRAAKPAPAGQRPNNLDYRGTGGGLAPPAILFGHSATEPIYLGRNGTISCRQRQRAALSKTPRMNSIDEIVENFTLLDEWDDRYRYVIELGRSLPPLPDSAHTDANKVQGCASQVWLVTHVQPDGAAGPVLTFEGDSDAHIVRGLVAILLALMSGKPAREILATDALALFDRIGLRENLTPQRSNGLRSMVERIRAQASAALAAAA